MEVALAGRRVVGLDDPGQRDLGGPSGLGCADVLGRRGDDALPALDAHAPADLGELALQVVQQVGGPQEQVAPLPGRGRGHGRSVESAAVEVGSITGEVSLLWRERDRYDGEVLLLTLDP